MSTDPPNLVGFDAFMAERQHRLLRFATALTGDAGLGEEIVSAVLARACERWNRIHAMDRVDAYVHRMIVNEFISFKRREGRTLLVPGFVDDTRSEPDCSSRYAEREELRVRLAALPARQRAAVVLRYYEDLADAEIASILGRAQGTVRSLISRALASLKVQITGPDYRRPPHDLVSNAPEGRTSRC